MIVSAGTIGRAEAHALGIAGDEADLGSPRATLSQAIASHAVRAILPWSHPTGRENSFRARVDDERPAGSPWPVPSLMTGETGAGAVAAQPISRRRPADGARSEPQPCRSAAPSIHRRTAACA